MFGGEQFNLYCETNLVFGSVAQKIVELSWVKQRVTNGARYYFKGNPIGLSFEDTFGVSRAILKCLNENWPSCFWRQPSKQPLTSRFFMKTMTALETESLRSSPKGQALDLPIQTQGQRHS